MRHLIFLFLVLVVNIFPAPASPATVTAPAPSSSLTVIIKDYAFSPQPLTISVGETVTFVNKDSDAHTVTSTDGLFDSKGLDTGDVWVHKFTKPGTYKYFCSLHPWMKGTIIVKAAQ
jgi:plastocyanin